MQAEKLSHGQIKDLHGSLMEKPLANYELLWVLESCLGTPASIVYGLGPFPWGAGLMAIHRSCIWLRLENEMFLESFLEQLPSEEIFRFYTAKLETLEMLQRWLPGGSLTTSSLYARPLTQSWKRRFAVTLQSTPDPDTLGGWHYEISDSQGSRVATCSSQKVVPPWQEIIELESVREETYWTEQALGAVTADLLAGGSPVVIRVDRGLFDILAPLGYREFNELYYYVTAGRVVG